MWLHLNFGSFSAVTRKEKDMQPGDNRTLQIRARDPKQLEELRERYMHDELSDVVELDFRDYQARAYCTPEAWGRALYAASMDIDYGNFKDSVKDNKLHNAYMKVWSALADEYGTAYHRGKGSRFVTTTRYYGSGYAGAGYGRGYQSMFGNVELDDKPYDGMHTFTESDYTDSADSIDAMLAQYAPFVVPEETPTVLTRGDVISWLGTTSSMFKKFLAGNAKWRTYRTGSQNRYEFPKTVMGEMSEHFDIWMSERVADATV